MKIATVDLLRNIKPPKYFLAKARHPGIETLTSDVPLGATCWIGCCYAWPHIDPYWKGQLFITLSVVSSHSVSDVLDPDPHEVPRGTLFVIDPMTRHWLQHVDAWHARVTAPWVGLQWEVKKKDAAKVAREIVAKLNGQWCITDKRYKGFQQ